LKDALDNGLIKPKHVLLMYIFNCGGDGFYDCLIYNHPRMLKYRLSPNIVLYWCETWSLTLREEHRLGVFENRVEKRIFGPKNDEVTGEWRKLHILYTHPEISLGKSKKMKRARHVTLMGEERKSVQGFGGKAQRKDAIRKAKA
jgi:hypothetical protein